MAHDRDTRQPWAQHWTYLGFEGLFFRKLTKITDHRGHLSELFRIDEMPPACRPVMLYVSMTQPGIVRGPHEHKEQTDFFCFIGPGRFVIGLWDMRPGPAQYQSKRLYGGDDHPVALIVPPGVAHAYRNESNTPGIVYNAANTLYKGWDKKQPVDEIRYEDNLHPCMDLSILHD